MIKTRFLTLSFAILLAAFICVAAFLPLSTASAAEPVKQTFYAYLNSFGVRQGEVFYEPVLSSLGFNIGSSTTTGLAQKKFMSSLGTIDICYEYPDYVHSQSLYSHYDFNFPRLNLFGSVFDYRYGSLDDTGAILSNGAVLSFPSPMEFISSSSLSSLRGSVLALVTVNDNAFVGIDTDYYLLGVQRVMWEFVDDFVYPSDLDYFDTSLLSGRAINLSCVFRFIFTGTVTSSVDASPTFWDVPLTFSFFGLVPASGPIAVYDISPRNCVIGSSLSVLDDEWGEYIEYNSYATMFQQYAVANSDASLQYSNGYLVGWADGHTSGYDTGKKTGYDQGYDAGYDSGYSYGHLVGYDDGHSVGVSDGKQIANSTVTETSSSYAAGYSAGVNAAGHYTFSGLLGSVLDVPVNAFMQFFNFEILGVNLTGFLSALFVICIIVTVFRLLFGG